MKAIYVNRFAFFLPFLFVSLVAQAQQQKVIIPDPSNFHSHSGFHFEFGLGPAFGTVNDKYANYYNDEFTYINKLIDRIEKIGTNDNK